MNDLPLASIDRAANSTLDWISQKTHKNPTAPAVTFLPSGALDAEATRLSRGEFLANIQQAANMFHGLGVGPTDVVSFLLPNLLEAQYTLWGAQAAGIVNPINFLLGADQIAEICTVAGTKVLVALGPHPTLDIYQKTLELKDRVPSLKEILIVGSIPDDKQCFRSFGKTLHEYPSGQWAFKRNIAINDTAALFHTGGTTGKPKLVPHSHGNEISAANATAISYGFNEQDVLINALPLFHVAAPILLTLAPLGAGAEVLIPTPAGLRDPLVLENHWQLVERYGVTIVCGVPTSLSDLIRVPLRGADISKVEFALTGGAPLSIDLEKRFIAHTGLPIHQIYGMTETSGVIAVAPRKTTPVAGSVGMSVPKTHVKAVCIDSEGHWLSDCNHGETGVLAVRGDNVFSGYRGNSVQTDVFIGDDWFNTGDMGHINEDGWIFITGRAKDTIIRSGHNIDPKSIEEVADTHPVVESCIAVGQPDVRAGEVPVVFVTVVQGSLSTADDILQYIKANSTEKPAKPVAVYIIPSMPLTPVGKIYRPKLRCEALRELIEKQLHDIPATISVTFKTNGSMIADITVATPEDKKQFTDTINSRLFQYGFDYMITCKD